MNLRSNALLGRKGIRCYKEQSLCKVEKLFSEQTEMRAKGKRQQSRVRTYIRVHETPWQLEFFDHIDVEGGVRKGMRKGYDNALYKVCQRKQRLIPRDVS